MNPEIYKNVDWADIYMKLLFVVSRCAAQMPDLFDGNSVEDIVTEVFSTFFEDPNGLGWNPEIGPLDRFLLGVAKNKTVDHIRRQRRIAGSLDDPDFVKRIHLMQATNKDQEIDELRAEFKKAAKGDPGLEELLRAIATVDGGHNTNQQLAEALNTTPQDIVNRKKRLIRRAKGSQ